MIDRNQAAATATSLATRLTIPARGELGQTAQSLADGAAGIALLHAERAHASAKHWESVQPWLTAATAGRVSVSMNSSLYGGAPAVAFALHTAAGQTRRYTTARTALDQAVATIAHRRVDAANARIGRGEPVRFTEYDVISGLTGIGAHLLAHAPGDDALGRILTYLVRLTTPINLDGEGLPGWWCSHDPSQGNAPEFAGGHANLGMAHGAAGPLALLALAARAGIRVDSQTDAINALCTFYDRWRQDTPNGPFWPQWINRADQRAARPTQPGPGRPSWCYGTPGIARALQLAGLATGDTTRQNFAEQALATCIADSARLAHLTEAGLCHGWAGLYQTVARAAADATTDTLSRHLPTLAASLLLSAPSTSGRAAGLLEGEAGIALVLHSVATGTPATGWDRCLLIH
ncbi:MULTISPECIES: lanthionine synthetase C family protein [Protofrankia]|uniref:Lanthionine synthetase n=1 Tax=Protofrankia coriariae TaxID=1562887 RepID=A0ABR5F4D9_9ACTN|nr:MULTISPECIES: lanthionine synthetase C family protein [Protofrankia]KLL11601.1 lanthionine synthetase [Protofrankia coriariae]ONH35747.1 lanthionine synthetase [Protofrankia sp. BMG5.30]